MKWDTKTTNETKSEVISLANLKRMDLKGKNVTIVQIFSTDGRVFSNYARIWDSFGIDIEPLKVGDKMLVEYIEREKDGRTFQNFTKVTLLDPKETDDEDLPF